ncbi:MAG: UDP-N-acetylmuramate dehydrogenase [Lachnospiraceae bacterium]
MLNDLISIVGREHVLTEEPMCRHTSFRIGGVAKFFVTVTKEDILIELLSFLQMKGQQYYVLGNGSNLLVDDRGYDGVIIKLDGEFKEIRVNEEAATARAGDAVRTDTEIQTGDAAQTEDDAQRGLVIQAGAGVLLANLSHTAWKHSLTGLEFAFGIPGTLGGAIVMNAGAYGSEMKQVVKSVRVLKLPQTETTGEAETVDGMAKSVQVLKLPQTETTGDTDSFDSMGIVGGEEKQKFKFQICEYTCEEMHFAYRHSRMKEMPGIVLSVTLELQKGNGQEIKANMDAFTAQRKEKQPLEYPSAGSAFKRPEGHFAGKLISDAGLKGYRVGDAMVSEKHAGFVINVGNATARDVKQLLADVSRIVYEKYGIRLEPEIIFL